MRYVMFAALCLGTLSANLWADRYIVDSHGCVTVVGSKFFTEEKGKITNKTKCSIVKRNSYEISR